MSHSLGLSLASWEDKGYVDLPSQSTSTSAMWWTALFALIEEADQNPQFFRRDDPQEAQMAFWSYTIGKGPCKGIIENQEIEKVGFSETHASGNRERPLTMIDEKPTDGTSTSKKDQDGQWNDEVWE